MRGQFTKLDFKHPIIFHLPFTPLDPPELSVPSYLPTPPATQESNFYGEPMLTTISYGSDGSEETLSSLSSLAFEPKIHLSPEQQRVLNLVKAGKNVFFTGAAGTGKSVLLKEIIKWCRGEGNRRLAVTASTGIASVNIGGSTLHSWAGIGLGKETAERLAGRILGYEKWKRMKERERRLDLGLPVDAANDSDDEDDKHPPRTVKRWRLVQVLIVDESRSHCTNT